MKNINKLIKMKIVLEAMKGPDPRDRELKKEYEHYTGRNFNCDVDKHMMSLNMKKPCRKDFMYDYDYERAVTEYYDNYAREIDSQKRKQLRWIENRCFYGSVEKRRALEELGEQARKGYW